MIVERGDNDLAYDCLVSKLWIGSVTSPGLTDEVLKRHAATIQRNLDKFRPIAAFRNISHDDGAGDEEQLLALLDEENVLVHSKRLATLVGAACSRTPGAPGLQGRAVPARRVGGQFLQ